MDSIFNWVFGFSFPYGLIVAMVSGLFGASFFMLIQLQQKISEGSLSDARDVWTFILIVLRCIVGIGAASILYFFFHSGLLEGSLWPDTSKLGFQAVEKVTDTQGVHLIEANKYILNRNFCLLIVWSFLAGYSQTLVPNLLVQTEGRLNKTAGGK